MLCGNSFPCFPEAAEGLWEVLEKYLVTSPSYPSSGLESTTHQSACVTVWGWEELILHSCLNSATVILQYIVSFRTINTHADMQVVISKHAIVMKPNFNAFKYSIQPS